MGLFDKFINAVSLKDDDELEDDEFYDEDDDDEEEPPKEKKGFFSRLLKSKDDEDDDEVDFSSESSGRSSYSGYTDRQGAAKTARSAQTKVTPMRRKSAKNMEVFVIKPSNMEDTREIADTLLAGCTVVLNLEGMDVEAAQRVIDFSSGTCYAIDGSLQKVSSYIFILTPANVGISGDIQDILNGSIPSMRNSY